MNAVLAAPALIVLFPLVLGGFFRILGLIQGPAPYLDTIPIVAQAALPFVGWLAAVPLALTLANLRMVLPPAARAGLLLFLLVHLATLAATAVSWTGRL